VTSEPTPWRISISPLALSVLRASRMAVELTANCWASSRSGGQRAARRDFPLDDHLAQMFRDLLTQALPVQGLYRPHYVST